MSQSISRAFSDSFAQGQTQSSSFVDPAQSGFLSNLRTQALNRQQGVDIGPLADISRVGQGSLSNLQSLGNQDAVVGAQLSSLRSGLQDLFAEQSNVNRGNAFLSGAGGSTRAALVDTALQGELANAYTRGFGDIMANANRSAIGANQAAIGAVNPLIAAETSANFADLGALQGLLGAPTVLNQSSGFDMSRSTSSAIRDAFSTANGEGSSSSVGFK
jgi:hypothetical protein